MGNAKREGWRDNHRKLVNDAGLLLFFAQKRDSVGIVPLAGLVRSDCVKL